jgi:hypothetical protein
MALGPADWVQDVAVDRGARAKKQSMEHRDGRGQRSLFRAPRIASWVVTMGVIFGGCGATRSGAPNVASEASRSAAAREEVKAFAVMYSPGGVRASCGFPVVTDASGGEIARYSCRAVSDNGSQERPDVYADHVVCRVEPGVAAVRARECRAEVRDQRERLLGHDDNADRATPASGSCPKHALDPGPHALEGVVLALRRAIPRIFQVVAYGRAQRLTPKSTEVLDVRSLGADGADLPGVRNFHGSSSYWGKLARRRCPAIASRSWMALVYFGVASAVPFAYRYAFFVRTDKGWVVWDHDDA